MVTFYAAFLAFLSYSFALFAMEESYLHSSLVLIHGTCAEKGNKRKRMEDHYFPQVEQISKITEEIYLFGVYDGHCSRKLSNLGGSYVANFIAQELPQILIDVMNQANQTLNERSITQTYQELDRKFCIHDTPAGATVVSAFFKGTTLWIANAGDAEAVACFDGKKAVLITKPHTADSSEELHRINDINIRQPISASVIFLKISNPKLERFHTITGEKTIRRKDIYFKKLTANNHKIIPTRGIGDKEVKPFSIPDPYTQSYELTKPGFLILASDGLWSNVDYQAAVNFILFELAERQVTIETITHEIAQEIATKLVQESLAIHDHDNVTVTIIFFNPVTSR